ncbi:MAG: hypothetical protein MJZ97_04295 [Bacteroidales bacterium]|nr:hypothetical protein [Bacteroidales bacterium]
MQNASTLGQAYTFTAKTDDYASHFKLVFGMNCDAASADSSGNFAFISNDNLTIDDIEVRPPCESLMHLAAWSAVRLSTTATIKRSTLME